MKNPKIHGFYKFSTPDPLTASSQRKSKRVPTITPLNSSNFLISMASAKLQKPTNETSSHAHEEHKFSQKISEMTTWGSRMFGHKHQEHQAMAKHCSTCQCPAPKKDIKPACTEVHNKKHPTAVKDTKSNARVETKKDKEGHPSTVHKDAKHTNCIELKKKEKQHTTNAISKDSKQSACAEMKKKEKKEQHTKNTNSDASNTTIKKQQGNHFFSSMAGHWKEKIIKMKKPKDSSSSSSDSDSDCEDEVRGKKKQKEKTHTQGTIPASK